MNDNDNKWIDDLFAHFEEETGSNNDTYYTHERKMETTKKHREMRYGSFLVPTGSKEIPEDVDMNARAIG